VKDRKDLMMMTKSQKSKMNHLLNKAAPIDWEKIVNKMTQEERGIIQRELEGISIRAAELSGYLEEREGYGCGDQGHKKAMRTCNRWGRKIWTKVFGYNDYIEINV
jgi:hypothetical protein